MKDKIIFKRDKETGELIAYKNDKEVSKIKTIGDDIKEDKNADIKK